MAEYKIDPLQKTLLEGFGLKNVAYKIYNDTSTAVNDAGLKLPVRIAASYGLNEIYKPGAGAVEADSVTRNQTGYDMFNGEVPNSVFGTPVFSRLKFSDTSSIIDKTVKLINWSPIDACLFTVNQSKVVVKTAIQGRNGTIKEYINDGDYNINIKGIITSERKGVYPYDEVKNLMEFLKEPKELYIEVPYLNDLFNIKALVVESYDFPQESGGISHQLFSINAVSDFPLTFKRNVQITKPNKSLY